MVALYGEWVNSNLMFSLAFLAALAGIVGIGVFVLRGDHRNRSAIDDPAVTSEVPTTTTVERL